MGYLVPWKDGYARGSTVCQCFDNLHGETKCNANLIPAIDELYSHLVAQLFFVFPVGH